MPNKVAAGPFYTLVQAIERVAKAKFYKASKGATEFPFDQEGWEAVAFFDIEQALKDGIIAANAEKIVLSHPFVKGAKGPPRPEAINFYCHTVEREFWCAQLIFSVDSNFAEALDYPLKPFWMQVTGIRLPREQVDAIWPAPLSASSRSEGAHAAGQSAIMDTPADGPQGVPPAELALSLTTGATNSTNPTEPNNRRGPRPEKTTTLCNKMINDLRTGTLTIDRLRAMKGIEGETTFGVSRDTFNKARKLALSEFVGVCRS